MSPLASQTKSEATDLTNQKDVGIISRFAPVLIWAVA